MSTPAMYERKLKEIEEKDARIAELQRICRIAYEDGMQGGAPLKSSTLKLLKSVL
jgi:hypothetical protein